MYRPLALSAVVLALLAARADAIEMFTNFNNGQNVGFPPMEVPVSVYGGFGRGGWNPYAEGMPLKTWPPVPAMMPTGQVPHTWSQPQYTSAPNGYASAPSAPSQPRFASERRRGRWQRGGNKPATGSGDTQYGESLNAGQSPTPAQKDDASDSPATVETTPSSRRLRPEGEYNPPTVLHAERGMPPVIEADPSVESVKSMQTDDDAPPTPPASLQSTGAWPQADALFPHGDAS